MSEVTKISKTIIGQVVSNKMLKTIVVELKRQIAHPLYGKYLTKTSKFYAHDESNSANVGDIVKIEFQRPLSKLKRWKLVEIVEKSNQI